MGYFEDFELLNVTRVKMYGSKPLESIITSCFYIGVIQGSVIVGDREENKPFVYFTPRNIRTAAGWHSPAGKSRDNFYIECRGARAERIFSSLEISASSRFFFVKDPEPYLAKLEEMQRLFFSGNPLVQSRVCLCLEEFAALLTEEFLTKQLPCKKKYEFEELMADISRYPEKKRCFEKEAVKCGVTLRHWNRLFTAYAGMAPYQFVLSCRLRIAKKLLVSEISSIKEISCRCGFESPAEFSRFFRKSTGVSPGRYRKNAWKMS